jgi:hypothetical protein
MNVITELNKQMEASPNIIEGYVVRLSREYHYSEFRNVCGKYVRKNQYKIIMDTESTENNKK